MSSRRATSAIAALAIAASAPSCRKPTPLGPPTPVAHPEVRVALGRQLFFDQHLSEPPGTSCASCHDPAQAYAGNNGSTNGVALGSRPGHFARRNTPSALYLKFVPRFRLHREEDAPSPSGLGGFFWDGRSDSLAALPEQPLTNPEEMNATDRAELLRKVETGPSAAALRKEFGALSTSTVMSAIGESIEAFLTSDEMSPFSSRYDDYVRGRAVLSPLEMRGLELFQNAEKGNCASCHRFNPSAPDPAQSLFTDYGFDAPGVPRNQRIPANHAPAYWDLGLCERNDRRSRTDDPRLCGTFKTPSLRNVAAREYLMHNGRFTSLRDAVAFYATRSTDPKRWYPSGVKFDDVPGQYKKNVNERVAPYDRKDGQRPRLDDGEIDAIVAFLETLTDAPFREQAEATRRKSEVSLRASH